MFELFSDIFAQKESFLSKIDPRVKLVTTMLLIFLVIFSTRPYFPALILILYLFINVIIRVPLILILTRLIIPGLTAALILIIKLFSVGTTVMWTVRLFGYGFPIYAEGFHEGLLIAARVCGAMSAMMLLSFTTPAHELFRSLEWFKVPRDLIEIAMLMYRYIFVLIEQATEVAMAQKVRLGYGSAKHSFSSAGILAGALLTRSVEQSLRTREAMTARGYNGNIVFVPMGKINKRDFLLSTLILIISIILFVFFERVAA